jgi:hypothetical protein
VHVQSCRYLHWSTRFTAKPVIRSSHSINVGVSETQLLRPVAGMQPAEHDPLQFGSEVTQVGAAGSSPRLAPAARGASFPAYPVPRPTSATACARVYHLSQDNRLPRQHTCSIHDVL